MQECYGCYLASFKQHMVLILPANTCNQIFSKVFFIIIIFSNSFDALEGPLGARSKELEDQVKFFQFNRDVDDELV